MSRPMPPPREHPSAARRPYGFSNNSIGPPLICAGLADVDRDPGRVALLDHPEAVAAGHPDAEADLALEVAGQADLADRDGAGTEVAVGEGRPAGRVPGPGRLEGHLQERLTVQRHGPAPGPGDPGHVPDPPAGGRALEGEGYPVVAIAHGGFDRQQLGDGAGGMGPAGRGLAERRRGAAGPHLVPVALLPQAGQEGHGQQQAARLGHGPHRGPSLWAKATMGRPWPPRPFGSPRPATASSSRSPSAPCSAGSPSTRWAPPSGRPPWPSGASRRTTRSPPCVWPWP